MTQTRNHQRHTFIDPDYRIIKLVFHNAQDQEH